MLTRKVALASAKGPGNVDRTLPLDEADHLRYGILGGNRDQDVHVIPQQMTFLNLALLLTGPFAKHISQISTQLAIPLLFATLGNPDNMKLVHPSGMT